MRRVVTVDTLSDQAIKVEEYDGHKYDNLYFDQDHFYKYIHGAYRSLYEYPGAYRIDYIRTKDVEGVATEIRIFHFKKDNNL